MTKEIKLKDYIDRIWNDFLPMYPLATKIHELLKKKGEPVINDHIAFRTFAHPNCLK